MDGEHQVPQASSPQMEPPQLTIEEHVQQQADAVQKLEGAINDQMPKVHDDLRALMWEVSNLKRQLQLSEAEIAHLKAIIAEALPRFAERLNQRPPLAAGIPSASQGNAYGQEPSSNAVPSADAMLSDAPPGTQLNALPPSVPGAPVSTVFNTAANGAHHPGYPAPYGTVPTLDSSGKFASGLDQLVHAAERERVGGGGLYHPEDDDDAEDLSPNGTAKTNTLRKKRPPSESLQLELDEDLVLKELEERGLLQEAAPDEARTFKGGRPPLGMGPYKKVKDLYDQRRLTMENWRVYYADKCRERGYDGAFRKDGRPRLNSKSSMKRAKSTHSGVFRPSSDLNLAPAGPGYTNPFMRNLGRIPASSGHESMPSEGELKLLRTLTRELQYPPSTMENEKFTWSKDLDDISNYIALRTYIKRHFPKKQRRGKKPEGISMFPMVFDLWSMSLIESSQYRRVAKYAGLDIATLEAASMPPSGTEGVLHSALHDSAMGLLTAGQSHLMLGSDSDSMRSSFPPAQAPASHGMGHNQGMMTVPMLAGAVVNGAPVGEVPPLQEVPGVVDEQGHPRVPMDDGTAAPGMDLGQGLPQAPQPMSLPLDMDAQAGGHDLTVPHHHVADGTPAAAAHMHAPQMDGEHESDIHMNMHAEAPGDHQGMKYDQQSPAM